MSILLLFLLLTFLQYALSMEPFENCGHNGWHCSNSLHGINLTYICSDAEMHSFSPEMISSWTVFQVNIYNCTYLKIQVPYYLPRPFPKVLSVNNVEELEITPFNDGYGWDDRPEYHDKNSLHYIPRIISIANVQSLKFPLPPNAHNPVEVDFITELNLTNIFTFYCGQNFKVVSLNLKNVNMNYSLEFQTSSNNYLRYQGHLPEPLTGEMYNGSWTIIADELVLESVTVNYFNCDLAVKSVTWLNVTTGSINSTLNGSIYWENVKLIDVKNSNVTINGNHTWQNVTIGVMPRNFYKAFGNVTFKNLKVEKLSSGAIDIKSGEFFIGDSTLGILERKSMMIESPRVEFVGNNIINVSNGAIGVRTKTFLFKQNKVTEVVADGFNIVSELISFEENEFGQIRSEAFSNVAFNYSNDKHRDIFLYLWKGNTVEQLEVRGLHPYFISFYELEDRIQLIENHLPCDCPLLSWSPENQPYIQKYFYNILIRRENKNKCSNTSGCLLKTVFDMFPNGHCTGELPNCSNSTKEKIRLIDKSKTTTRPVTSSTSISRATIRTTSATTTTTITPTNSTTPNIIVHGLDTRTKDTNQRSTSTSTPLTTPKVTTGSAVVRKYSLRENMDVKLSDSNLPLSTTQAPIRPPPQAERRELKQDTSTVILEKILSAIKEENSGYSTIFVLIGLPLWVIIVYKVCSKTNFTLYKRSLGFFLRREENILDGHSLTSLRTIEGES